MHEQGPNRVRLAPVRDLVCSRVGGSFRKRRAERFLELMQPAAGETIVDVGAYDGAFWMIFFPRQMRTGWHVVTCDILPVRPNPAVDDAFVANACFLPLRDRSVDIVFSNSVLEHVGDLDRQRRYATEIQRVARRYFVEVPNRHFPIEPHFYIPFLQYLPIRWQVAITRRLFNDSEEIRLPDHSRLRTLFPAATIERERFLGLTKAFYVWDIQAAAAARSGLSPATPAD